MTFPIPPDRTPTSIGQIEYEFLDPNGITQNIRAWVTVQVLDEENEHLYSSHVQNLKNHLTNDEKQFLADMLARLRALAETELLP